MDIVPTKRVAYGSDVVEEKSDLKSMLDCAPEL